MARRVLILTYYFPPAGGPGVQRTLKFVKYLPEFEWIPEVVTVRDGAYPAEDPSLVEDVPQVATVHRTPSLDPYQLYAQFTGRSGDDVAVGSLEGRGKQWTEQLARWVRANLFLPDARVGWVPFAVWRGYRLLTDGQIDAIVTSGPPHSTHLAGALLNTASGIPWVADFRDPWTDINYYQELPHTGLARKIDAALERTVIRRAQAVTTVSPSWRELLREKGDGTEKGTFRVIHNGYDDADVDAQSSEDVESETFTITHVGSLYASRNPVGLWRALRQLRSEGQVPALRVRLVGTVDPNVRESLQRWGLTDITECISYVPHPEAVRYMQRAALLLLSIEQFPAAGGMLTGKVYEYLATGRPIVGVGPAEGDAAALLQKTDGGRLFDWDDVEGLVQYVRSQYDAWANGTPRSGASTEAVRPYRRRAQTGQLAEVLREVAAS